MSNMVPKHLADEVSKICSGNKVEDICEALMTVIIDKVKKGEEVTLSNFIKFERVLNKERATKPAHYSMRVKVLAETKEIMEAVPIDPKKTILQKKKKVNDDEDELVRE